jgi:hypothetical protein
MTESGEGRAPDYDLVVGEGKRFVLFYRDAGVWLGGESIGFMRKGSRLLRPFRDLRSVTLRTRALPRAGAVGECDLRFKNGERFIVMNVNGHGYPERDLTVTYREFVRAFHERLVEAGIGSDVVFRSGYDVMGARILTGALVAGAALFVGLPVALVVMTGRLESLALLLAGAVLLWPAFKILGPNRPSTYTPDRPPDLFG